MHSSGANAASARTPQEACKPLIVHVLDRLDMGGMETVAASLIERTRDRYRHRVICLRGYSAFADRFQAMDVPVVSLDKRAGKDVMAYFRLRRMLRGLAPDLVQTYNIGAIDVALWAWLAGVRRVVHAEHGPSATDPQGRNVKYRWLRRGLAPAIDAFVVVSGDLAGWLKDDVGIAPQKVRLIYNGIDTERYRPASERPSPWPPTFAPAGSVVIGTVGRLDSVKAYDDLLKAFAKVRENAGTASLRLVIVGDGPERAALERLAHSLGVTSAVWFAGARDDVPRLLQALDVYVCSSIAEGVALTVLEAMASGLPVVATRVGGNPELVVPGETGALVPASDPQALAAALEQYAMQSKSLRHQGQVARARVQAHFSIDAMTAGYCTLYDRLLGVAPQAVEAG